jgi:hypothetical protein
LDRGAKARGVLRIEAGGVHAGEEGLPSPSGSPVRRLQHGQSSQKSINFRRSAQNAYGIDAMSFAVINWAAGKFDDVARASVPLSSRLCKSRSEHLDAVLAKYGGRLVKLTGDGALSERLRRENRGCMAIAAHPLESGGHDSGKSRLATAFQLVMARRHRLPKRRRRRRARTALRQGAYGSGASS